MTISELQLALPEIFVLGMTCVVLLADLFISDERRGLTHALAMVTLLFAGILSLGSMMAPGDIEEAFAGTFVRDRFGDILKVFSYLIFLGVFVYARSEEHTSELQSRGHLVCPLRLEKKNSQRARGARVPVHGQ